MIRRSALAAAATLALAAATPALAQTPFACRIGPYAKTTHMIAERFDMVVVADPREEARTEYRVTVRNPHPWPAAVLTGIEMRGIVESPAEPATIPPRGSAELVIGWFPLANPVARMAPPMLDAVRAEMTIPLCEVMRPDNGRTPAPGLPSISALPSAPRAVPASRLEVVGDEGPNNVRHRL